MNSNIVKTLFTVGGLVLSLGGTILTGISNDRKQKEIIEKEVAKAVAKAVKGS